jgi:peptidoglycan/xylan/chitin deacetylase (PgdA/CDA1 family)
VKTRRARLARIREKHAPEARALFGRQVPAWLLPGARRDPTEIPVFVFHDVEAESLDDRLRHLVRNGYRAVTAAELVELEGRAPRGERLVALTFDDATWRFRAVAFPLLRRHGLHAILFVVPGVVTDEAAPWPDLDAVREGRATAADLAARGGELPFCTWAEIARMRESGLVDVQSHTLSHQRVPVGPKVLDFVRPGLNLYYGHFDLPICVLDDDFERTARPGAPLFASAPRLAGRPRFVERPELVRVLVDHAASEPRGDFFASPSWRGELRRVLRRWPPERRGTLEPPAETEAAMRREIVAARDEIARRLPGAAVRHLAYPWHAGGPRADRLAAEAGMDAVYYGPWLPPSSEDAPPGIRRLPESCLRRLPGRGRTSFTAFLRERASRTRWPWGSSP